MITRRTRETTNSVSAAVIHEALSLLQLLRGHDAEDEDAQRGGTEDPGRPHQVAKDWHVTLPDIPGTCQDRYADRPDAEDDKGHVKPDNKPVGKGHEPILGRRGRHGQEPQREACSFDGAGDGTAGTTTQGLLL